MPVTVIVGGQFGSEGKGKVAHAFAKEMRAAAAIRVGGTNSGHTVISETGERHVFRQLPTAALIPDCTSVIPAGAYVDPKVLLKEVSVTGVTGDRLVIDPNAFIVTAEDAATENESGLKDRIGSTLTGTGAAVTRRISRADRASLASACEQLHDFVRPASPFLRALLASGARIILEGTQGYGLSVLHSPFYPYVTSRDTTAAGFLSEAGLSPLDVDDIVLVLRAFPIRVAGSSGPLECEVDWETVTRDSGSPEPIVEYTSVTHAVRRVARFSPDIVKRAIAVNSPTRIVLNHLDYVDHAAAQLLCPTEPVTMFMQSVCASVGRSIDFLGLGPAAIVPNAKTRLSRTA